MRFALPGVFVALLTPLALAERIAVAPFSGPGASEVRAQVMSSLCDLAECVPEKKVTVGGKPDWKKARKEKVQFIVAGKVSAKGKKKTLELLVEHKAGPPKLKKTYPLVNGQLSDKNLTAAAEALGKAMGLKGTEAAAPAEAKKEPPAEEAPSKAEEKKAPAEEKKEKKPPAEEKPRAAEEKEPEERKPAKKAAPAEPPPAQEEGATEAVPTPVPQPRRPIFSAEVGCDFENKTYSYSGATISNTLRSYKAPFIAAPDLKAEVYPVALATQGPLAGLGAELGFSFSVALKSKRTTAAGVPEVTYPTTINRLDVALKFQIRPVVGSEAYFAPFVGFRSHTFSVGVGSDGSTLDGLPSTSYSALKFGLAGELPFASTGLLAFARFAVLPVLSAPDVIGANPAPRTTFFASGSALGIDFALGLGFKLPPLPSLQLRVGFDFARYGLSFKTAATDTYVADGAVDQYLGGNAALRFTY